MPRIHPTAEVSPSAQIGEGTSIWNQAQVREDTVIGENCILSKDVYVDYGVHIGNNVKVQNGVSIYHGVTIEDGVFVGPNVCFTNDKYPRAINTDGSLKSGTDWQVSETRIGYGAALGARSVILPGVKVSEGKRLNRETPDSPFRGTIISEILYFTTEEAARFFTATPSLRRAVQVNCNLGPGYIRQGHRCGQPVIVLT